MSSSAHKRCQQIYWDLLRFVDKAPGDTKPCKEDSPPYNLYGECEYDTACSHIRKLNLTPQCDAFKDLSQMRRDFEDALGDERMQEIRQSTDYDNKELALKLAAQAATHYRSEHRRELISALSWPNRLLYAWRNM